MGGSSSKNKNKTPGAPSGSAPGGSGTKARIDDKFESVPEVQSALRNAGLESSNLIVAIDFTKSNTWTGQHSFANQCLHTISPDLPNPYEQVIAIIGATLAVFDDDNMIPAYGFGDVSANEKNVFSFNEGDEPCEGFENVLRRYQEIAPSVKLAGPTTFGPIIRRAIDIVREAESYHILLIVCDGQVTRSVDTPSNQRSQSEEDTINAIVEASKYPLSIVCIGVGDGPWEQQNEFDDRIPARDFDNYQFVCFTELMRKSRGSAERAEASFALNALMEIPDQYRSVQELGLSGHRERLPALKHTQVAPLGPPAAANQRGSFRRTHQSQHDEPPPPAYGST